jgi:acetyltransferase
VAYESAFKRAGVIRCDSIKEQFDFAQAFANQPLPEGPNVAVLTNAGGPGIMAADAIEERGLTFAKLSEETMKKLAEKLPAAANVHNPVDVLGDALADRYEFALDIVLDDPNVNSVLVLLTPQAMTQAKETAEAVVKVIEKKKKGKPVLACFLGASKVAAGVEILRRGSIPQYDSPSGCSRSTAARSKASWRGTSARACSISVRPRPRKSSKLTDSPRPKARLPRRPSRRAISHNSLPSRWC